MAVRQPGLRPLNKTGYVMALPLRGGRAFLIGARPPGTPCALKVLSDFAPSITRSYLYLLNWVIKSIFASYDTAGDS